MVVLWILDGLAVIIGAAGLLYQIVCLAVSLFSSSIEFPDAPQTSRFAVLISARNEEQVIGHLIESIQRQTYPSKLIDIWVVADNCTDNTAKLVESLGCHVVERFNTSLIGKGYALEYLLQQMREKGYGQSYDAYFVFDADNRLDPEYIAQMHKVYAAGFEIVTGYRNSLNLSDNWVSAGSALWFIRESRFLNNSRMILGTSCHVGGTGFMFSSTVMKRNQGWKFHLLTEDLEFTMDSLLHGNRIGYCGKAVLFDEQPVTFAQSWRQRLRWSKGFLQVFRYYGLDLLKYMVRERDFSAIDFTLLLCPFALIAITRSILGVLFAAFGFVTWASQGKWLIQYASTLGLALLFLLVVIGITTIVERKNIGATNKELVAYILSFPVYILSYVPISFQAVFAKSQWKPIEHKGVEESNKSATTPV